MLRGMRKVVENPDLWLLLFVQSFAIATMTAPLLFADSGRQGIVTLFSQGGLTAMVGIGVAIAWRRNSNGDSRPPWGPLAVLLGGAVLGLCFDDPRIAGVVVIAGLRSTLIAKGLASARRGLAPLLFGAALFSIARLSDEVFLWSVGASEFLWNARFSFERLMDRRMAAHAFGYARGFEAIFALAFLSTALAMARGRARLVSLALILFVANRFLVHAGDLVSFDLWIAFTPALVIAAMSLDSSSLGAGDQVRPRERLALCSSLGVAAAGLLFWLPHAEVPSVRRSVLLEGRYEISVPNSENPEKARSASLGFFHRYFEGVVDDLAHVKTITPEILEGRDSLFLCNLGRELTPDESTAILHYVQEGGKLCVLGDHTDIFGVMRFTNPLIENFGIRLVFDSAIPFGRNWIGSLDTRWHPITAGLESPDQVRISVGATLEVSGAARPLIVARKGYSDIGDYGAPQKAFLGSWSYEPTKERMGGLVLAADARFGAGRVVVFGDTAFTQEASFSASWSFVSGLLRDQFSTGDSWASRGRLALGLFLLIATLFATCFLRLRALPVAIVALVSLSAFAGIRGLMHERFQCEPLLPSKVAWLDLRKGSNLDVVSKDSNEMGGFANALIAAGYVPLVRVPGESMNPRPSDVVVLPSGGRPLSGKDARELESFTRAGGRVLAFAGAEDRKRYAAVLADQGIGIGADPLGICPAAQVEAGYQEELPMPGFRQAWPLELGSQQEARRLVTCFGHPVVVEVPRGEGEWIWIADGRFGWNENFKRGEAFQPRNFRFLAALLKRGS